MKPNEYRRVTDVTYLGVVYGTMAALKRMLPRNRAPRGMAGMKKRCEASSARLYLFSIDINSAACSFDAPQYYAMTIKEQRPATRSLRPIPAICANYTVGGLRVPKGEDVILYFDRNEEFLHQVNRVWLKLKKRKDSGWARQTRGIIPVDSSQYAIQAADFIAWTMNREQTHGDYAEWTTSAKMLSESKLYDYDAIVEQYANDKWS